MSSVAQIEANQANAQLSTGPTTPEGKARSSANSTKLGLYASQAVLLTPEDHLEFQSLSNTYEYELRPRTPVQFTLFTQIILAAWNILRANRLEAELAAAEGIHPLLSENKTFARITAARTKAERTFHKCLKELRVTQSTQPPAKPIVKNEAKYISSGNDPFIRSEPKTGRNEPCPCNSGRKFKYCCLENEANLSSSHAG